LNRDPKDKWKIMREIIVEGKGENTEMKVLE
jgi:hypothetical protein